MSKNCIVIPCYNEANRLDIGTYLKFISQEKKFYLFFVNDGSNDDTLKVLNELKLQSNDKIFILNLTNNQGKSEAVRQGILNTKNLGIDFDVIGYLDADLSIPLNEFKRLNNILMKENVLLVFGSRIRRVGVQIHKSLIRHILSRIFATVASNMLGIVIYDTQCGIKLFRSEIIESIFSEPFQSKWFFDIEIFYRFNKLIGKKDINKYAVEVPLNHCLHTEGSKINAWNYIKTPFELLKIYKFYNLN